MLSIDDKLGDVLPSSPVMASSMYILLDVDAMISNVFSDILWIASIFRSPLYTLSTPPLSTILFGVLCSSVMGLWLFSFSISISPSFLLEYIYSIGYSLYSTR